MTVAADITVRRAEGPDIPAMSRILIASITRLCSADHGDAPEVIAAWTANKSEPGVALMLHNPDQTLFVAERAGRVVAVGAVSGNEITLNYVDPDHRRTGVSGALLAALERELAGRGVGVASLRSTATARDFYLSQGWTEDAPVPRGRFITAIPMHKVLG